MLSGSFSIWHWMIVLVIVMAIFGTKKLRNAGGDLGAAVRNFKSAMQEGEAEAHRDFVSGQLTGGASAASTTVQRDEHSSHIG